MKGFEKHVHEVGLFFYLVSDNERVAEALAQKTIAKFKDSDYSMSTDVNERDRGLFSLAVENLFKNLKSPTSLKKYGDKNIPFLSSHATELGPWKQFQKKARVEDLITVSLVAVLKLDPIVAANIQGISEGTLKYRMSRGLKQMSQYLNQNLSTEGA